MKAFLVAVVLAGLSVVAAVADEKPTPPPSKLRAIPAEADWRVAKRGDASPLKVGVLTYYPNNGGGLTFLDGPQLVFYSLPYEPSTYKVTVDEFEKGQVRHNIIVVGTIGTHHILYGSQTVYRSEMRDDRSRDGGPSQSG